MVRFQRTTAQSHCQHARENRGSNPRKRLVLKYLLDTDTCIDVLRGRDTMAPEHIMKHEIGEIAISAITHHELMFGLHHINSKNKWDKFKVFTRNLSLLPFDDRDSEKAASIRSELEKCGLGIGILDSLIGGQALAKGLVLITSNKKHFGRISKLKLEDWRDS